MSVKSLKLEFSKAADRPRVDALFDPAVKNVIDPESYVVKRLESAFCAAVDEGAAAMLSDRTGDVQTLTIAYRCADYTELGTTMARLPGFHSAKLVVAALALKEWLNAPPQKDLVAEIRNDNIPSIKVYRDALGWLPVGDRDEEERIFADTDTTVANEKDKCADIDAALETVSWYRCDNATLAIQARIVLELMKQGGLTNRKTGAFIPVDFSALEDEGLTPPRLEAMAQGETERAKIRGIKPL